jgi:sulfite reductase (NADPH) flavoprotein alpha-component
VTQDPVRLAAAVVVAAAYALFCLVIAWRRLRRRRLSGDGGGLLIAFASQTGFGEELARAAGTALAANGAAVQVAELGAIKAEDLRRWPRILFVVATTGDGDAPDPAARFVRTVMSQTPDLSDVSVGVLALGDRSYVRFCAFGRRLDDWLAACGAQALFPRVEVDAGDPAALTSWRNAVAALQPGAIVADLQAAPGVAWTLAARTLLNPQGAGDPVYLVVLEPPADAAPVWAAGDVVELEAAPGGALVRREYSIASLPQDGRIELLVRVRRRDDGGLGLMSGWLTLSAPIGAPVVVRLRSNRSFHPPQGAPPMVLIGAGTGLAGLRPHLRARRAAGAEDAWLIFGERTRSRDFLLADEVLGWRADGVLSRLDLAFSRDAGDGRYVQDVLRAEADALREHLARGAVLYVCGSHDPMGSAVHATLGELLGEEALEELLEAGRYRRDTY